jgi:hypothetical protein
MTQAIEGGLCNVELGDMESHDLLYLCPSLSSDLFLEIVNYFVDWLHTSLLSSLMVLYTDI